MEGKRIKVINQIFPFGLISNKTSRLQFLEGKISRGQLNLNSVLKKYILVSFLFFSFLGKLFAQEQVFFFGFFPEAAVTKSLSNGKKINFKVENQETFFRNTAREGEKWDVRHYRTDFMGFYSWQASPVINLAIGAFHRIQDGANANRIIQQMAFLQRLRSLRIAHRIRTDQTATRGESLEWRLRYRVALDIPLDGKTLDPGENYLVLSNEPIFSLQDGEFELENRLVFTLGKLINEEQKLEYSIDYRTDGFFQEGFRTRLWAKIGYFYNF
ncbi:Protein of unknown function [Algoriphagus ornithinivorans]|uniref:DUF2490 domain-containing protein n=1 Tax=Algoriphagus ornithinivorans TaxID=226506 RepID=A0A1I5BSZ4_9BACT|nr:Protein of unknown function [Algoriphagus ornithinivorans]